MNSWFPNRPLLVQPKPGESARGFVLRLAQRNRITFDQMCDWTGLPKRGTPFDVPAVDAARIIGLDPGEFEHMGFEVAGHGWVIGHQVAAKLLFDSRIRLCPVCLSEDAFHRRIWDLRQVTVCPIHRVALVGDCYKCGRILRWSRSSIVKCGCGFSLANAPTSQETDGIGAAVVYRRCGIMAGEDLHEDLRSLPLADLLELLFFFGRADVMLAQGNPYHLATWQMESDSRILNAGACVAQRWPEGFLALLERVREAMNRHKVHFGFQGQFGYVHRFVASCGDKPYAAALRSAYADYFARRPDVPFTSLPGFLSTADLHATYVRRSEALAISGLGKSPFRQAMRSELWQAVRMVKSSDGVELYSRQDVLAFSEKVRRLISYRVADAALGFPKGGIERLVDAGLLKSHPVNRSRKVVNHSVDRADVEALIEGLEAHAEGARRPADPVRFKELIVRCTHSKFISFVDLFSSMLEGRLRPYLAKPQARGMTRFVFESSEVESVLNTLELGVSDGAIPLCEAAAMLRLPTEIVHGLTSAGFLPPPKRHADALLFDREAVVTFWDKYTYPYRIARQHGTTPGQIRDTLEAARAVPIAQIPTRSRLAMPLYRLEDIQHLPFSQRAARHCPTKRWRRYLG